MQKNNHTYNLVLFDIAFWGLLAALWIAGAYQIYYTAIEQLAKTLNVPEYALWLLTVILISTLFLFFRKKITIFKGNTRMVTNSRHRRKKNK